MATLIRDLKSATVTQLVLAAQAGQRDAFGELFERFQRHVQAIALRRLGDWNEAQELCQEVFLQALQKIQQLREPECFVAWLRAITNRMAINRAVRRSPESPAEPETLDIACVEDDTPLTIILADERQAEVRAGLASAPRPGPANAAGVLRRGPVVAGDERRVRCAAGNDQAASAHGAEAAGQARRSVGGGVKKKKARSGFPLRAPFVRHNDQFRTKR